ncbi:hypothetical protein LX36DRAFT_174373 [Colletotrichum falcatum]|nr:hypothetical protein LX36DRAFT_174373 [Colletotrichum falcatum]
MPPCCWRAHYRISPRMVVVVVVVVALGHMASPTPAISVGVPLLTSICSHFSPRQLRPLLYQDRSMRQSGFSKGNRTRRPTPTEGSGCGRLVSVTSLRQPLFLTLECDDCLWLDGNDGENHEASRFPCQHGADSNPTIIWLG